MLIKPTENPDPLKINNAKGEEIFRITPTGDIYWKGRFIEGDEELKLAVTEMVQKMNEYMRPPEPVKSPWQIGRKLYFDRFGIEGIWAAIPRPEDYDEAFAGYMSAFKSANIMDGSDLMSDKGYSVGDLKDIPERK